MSALRFWIRDRLLWFAPALLLLSLALWKDARAQQRAWSAAHVSASLRDTIAGGEQEAKADPGAAILEIVGEFGSSANTPLSILVQDIAVTATFTTEAALASSRRVSLLGIGLRGNTGVCSYIFPHTFVRGVTRKVADADGNGYELQKGEEHEPAALTLTKNPSRICLGFPIPSRRINQVSLSFGNTSFPVPAP